MKGSRVILRLRSDPVLPHSSLVGTGVREVIWGVDSAEHVRKLTGDLARDRDLKTDADGTVHFLTDCGLPMGLRAFHKRPVVSAPGRCQCPRLGQATERASQVAQTGAPQNNPACRVHCSEL